MKAMGGKSITFRLTLLFATVSTAVLLLLGLLIGASVDKHFVEQDMEVPVSYTHLDVYKRQRMDRAIDCSRLHSISRNTKELCGVSAATSMLPV